MGKGRREGRVYIGELKIGFGGGICNEVTMDRSLSCAESAWRGGTNM
jgi:hypothetical protein